MRPALLALWLLVVLPFAAAGPADPPAPIAVGTFNIRYANKGDGANAWEHRQAMVLDMLKDGDFWGLQEALPEQVMAIGKGLTQYGMLVRSREADPSKGEACPILYRTERWTIDKTECGTFWLSEKPDEAGSKSWDSSLPRIATFARFTEKGSGRSLYVFNTHLDHQGEKARLEAAKLLAKRIANRKHADEPVVLLGDFNTGPTSPPIQQLLGDTAIHLVDAWRVANPKEAERGTFNGWADTCTGERIDFILPSEGLAVDSCTIDDRKPDGHWPSDHAAVRAVLQSMAPAAPRSIGR